MSFPLDGGLQERCKTAADTQIGLQQQMTANKRLDFEIARLKNCGELMKQEFILNLEQNMLLYVQMWLCKM